jgi:RNA polymerase sigma-70 factor (ECF subfamily)
MAPAVPIGFQAAAPAASVREDGDETALVRRAQAGDEPAFRLIVERYQSRVLSIVRGILHQGNDEDDIAQQVFVKAYFGIRGFDGRSSLWSWLYRITVNECYDHLRKRKVRPLVYESDLSGTEGQCLQLTNAREPRDGIDSVLARREWANWLLQRLSEKERFLLLVPVPKV